MRELSLYDGQEFIGTIKIAKAGNAIAFDKHGKRLGSFPSFEAASAALTGAAEQAPQRP